MERLHNTWFGGLSWELQSNCLHHLLGYDVAVHLRDMHWKVSFFPCLGWQNCNANRFSACSRVARGLSLYLDWFRSDLAPPAMPSRSARLSAACQVSRAHWPTAPCDCWALSARLKRGLSQETQHVTWCPECNEPATGCIHTSATVVTTATVTVIVTVTTTVTVTVAAAAAARVKTKGKSNSKLNTSIHTVCTLWPTTETVIFTVYALLRYVIHAVLWHVSGDQWSSWQITWRIIA